MTFSLEQAKDGNITCKINSIFIHSAYSPVKESQRFIDSYNNLPFSPELIFLLEPGLSYTVPFLRRKFPTAKLCVIRFCSFFKEKDSLFDYSFYFNEQTDPILFENDLYSIFGEELLSFSTLLPWEATGKLFESETLLFFKSYKNLINKCHSVLRTRAFFEKRWITNSCKISCSIRKNVLLKQKGTCPVLICASGPSLKDVIPIIKECKNIFIIAVSSAILPLVENAIIPDLCISTDGGFWAKNHLHVLNQIKNKTILALACEGNAPSKLLIESSILPLTYNDGIESEIFRKTGIKSLEILRSGTVSGTALDLARKISDGPVYFAGLDLFISKGFQHTQSNELEKNDSIKDNRLISSEKRNSIKSFSNQRDSLLIYENWFKTQNWGNNIFRIINNPQNNLGRIKDIPGSAFNKTDFTGTKPVFYEQNSEATEKRNNTVMNFIKDNSKTENWIKNVFPSEYLNIKHSLDENQKEALSNKIYSENEKLLKKLCKIFTKKQ